MGDFELPYAASAIKATPLWTDTPAPLDMAFFPGG
jgi:hypothetical protein